MNRFATVVFFAALSTPILTQANLVLTIDSETETLFLSGFDSGNLAMVDIGGFFVSEAAWFTNGAPSDAVSSFSLLATVDIDPAYPGSSFNFTVDPSGLFLIEYFTTSAMIPAIEFTGISNLIDYSSLSAEQKSSLESLAGSFTTGKGNFSNIAIQVIPEKAAVPFILGLIAAGWVASRRRK